MFEATEHKLESKQCNHISSSTAIVTYGISIATMHAGCGMHLQGTGVVGMHLQGTGVVGMCLQGTGVVGMCLQGTGVVGMHLQGTGVVVLSKSMPGTSEGSSKWRGTSMDRRCSGTHEPHAKATSDGKDMK